LAERLAERHRILARADFVAGDLRDAAFSLPKAELVAASFVLAEIDEQEDIIARLWTAATDTLVLIEPGTPAGFDRIRQARQWLIEQGAHVLAPCTHDSHCPIEGSNWCHFSQRLPRSRDHLKMKDATVPFEDERYSYVAVSHAPVPRADLARIIAPPEESKAELVLPLCTERGLHRAIVSRRQRDRYVLLRKAKWGDTILSEE
jgi:ribosomal protein RSM22 (predicted rRNA methylase)